MNALLRFLAPIAVSVLWTCLYVIAAIQAGGFILSRIRGSRAGSEGQESTLERLNLSFLLGLAALSVLIVALGLFGFLNRLVLVSLLILSAFILAIRLSRARARIPSILSGIRSSNLWSLSPPWIVFSIALACIVALFGFLSLLQPVSGDAEAYYMTIAKVMAYSERLVALRNYASFSTTSWFGELHFAALITIFGLISAKFLVWFLFLSIAASIHTFGKRLGNSQKAQVVSQTLLVASSTVYYYIADGKVDLFAAALGLAAFTIILKNGKTWSLRECVLAGLLIGFSAVAKMTYLPIMYVGLFVALGCGLFLDQRRISIPGIKTIMARGMIIAAVSLTAFIPHIVKNISLFGEPLAPFVYLHTLPEGGVSLQQAWFSPESTRYIILTYPLQLFFGRFPMQGGTMSPLLLALLPIGLVRLCRDRERRSLALSMAITAISGIVAWAVIRPSWFAPRYMLAPLLLLVPLGGSCLDGANLKPLARGAAALVLAFLVAGFVVFSSEVGLYRSAKRTASALYHARELESPNQDGISFLNKNVPEGDRVFVDGWYTYYMRPDILACMSEERQWMMQLVTYPDLLRYLRQRDFKFIYVEKASASKLFENLDGFPAARIYDDARCSIYKLQPSDGKVAKQYSTVRDIRGHWTVVQVARDYQAKDNS
jgi:hypothetical protein